MLLTLKTVTPPITLTWAVESYGNGAFEMSQKAIDSVTEIYMGQPDMDTTELQGSETYALISKAAYKSLIDTKIYLQWLNLKTKLLLRL